MTFVIFHGSFGHPQEHWFPEVQNRIEQLGHRIYTPKFPADDWDEITKNGEKIPPRTQNLNSWLETWEGFYPTIKEDKELVFLGHSLGPLFILHIVEKYKLRLNSAIFVSPFLTKLYNVPWQFNHVNATFYKSDFNFDQIRKLIPLSYVVYGEDDPYVDKRYPLLLTNKLKSSLIPVRSGGHINKKENYTLILELCKTRVVRNS